MTSELDPKTLYLHTELEVSLEGPALCIKGQDQAERLFPLRYLDRIQADRRVRWQTDALLACAKRNILIQFTDAKGQTLARLFGPSPTTQTGLIQRLEHRLARPDWQDSYHNWCHGRRLQTQKFVAQHLGYRFNSSKQLEQLPHWCRARLPGNDPNLNTSLQWLETDLYGLASHILQQQAAHQGQLCLQTPIDLARDLCRILGSLLLLVRKKGLQASPSGTALNRQLVTEWFNQQRSFLRYQIERMLNLFELWTLEG